MSLFSKIFSKKLVPEQRLRSQFEQVTARAHAAKLHPKGEQDAEGLYPGEVVLLYYAESIKTDGTNFPKNLLAFGMTNPQKSIKKLEDGGYVRVGGPKGTLPSLKVAELKEIAKAMGVKQSGRKADIIAAISESDEARLSSVVTDRVWELTDLGREALKRNAYVGLYLDDHEYDSGIVDFWELSKACAEHPNMSCRDVFYHQVDSVKNAASRAIISNPTDCAEHLETFCECLRTMALFIEEEGLSYVNAADFYFQYLFERINVEAGMKLAMDVRFFSSYGGKLDRATVSLLTDSFYNDSRLEPFHQKEVMRIKEEANISDRDFRKALIGSFERAEHSGFMSTSEAANFVVYELSGDNDKSVNVSKKAARRAMRTLGAI